MIDFICEIGVNHENDIDLAKRMIDEIASNSRPGISLVAKFQIYTADTLAVKNSPAYWDTSKEPTLSQHALFSKYDKFSFADYQALHEYCVHRNIEFLATAFSVHHVRQIDPLVCRHKVSSSDITNIPLLRAVAETGKPVILSTGASTVEEITAALNCLRLANSGPISLMHCVLLYPTPDDHANLSCIDTLRSSFPGHEVGYSDHTVPDPNLSILKAVTSKGVKLFEKHFTYDKSLTGNDHYHAIDCQDLSQYSSWLQWLATANGDGDLVNRKSEQSAIKYARRSIVSAVDIPAGTVLTPALLTTKRPATGMPASDWDVAIGSTALIDIPADTIINKEHLATFHNE